jgi:excinuclease ABC subunit C
MKELLSRRVESFSKESPPNLWVIDGGATLLKLALSILKEKNINLDVVAIAKEKLDFKAHRAKGSAKDILYTQYGHILELKPSDKRLQFLQKLRDEAHRFAISYHKLKKQKEDMKLELLEQKGINKATIKKLLQYFGTFEEIQKATFEDIKKVTNLSVAKKLKG